MGPDLWWVNSLISIFGTVLASGGFWAVLQKKMADRAASSQMLKGLAHDRIIFIGSKYIERGWITIEEYDDFMQYLVAPYEELGGNGSAAKIVEQVKKLPVRRVQSEKRVR